MRNLLILLFIFIASATCFCQSSLKVEEDYWSGLAVYQNGNKISISDAQKIAKENLDVVKKLSAASTNRTIGGIIGYPGAFAFGYTLGTSFNKQVKSNWTVGGIGAAMMIGGIILQSKGNKQLKEAVEEYNSSLAPKTTSIFKPQLYIATSDDGVGLAVRF